MTNGPQGTSFVQHHVRRGYRELKCQRQKKSFLLKILVILAVIIQLALFWTSSAVNSVLILQNDFGHVRLLSPSASSPPPPPPPSSGSEKNFISDEFLPKVLVIYFPQFHPDPLNDRLWGANFSDWNNLRAAPEKNNLGFAIPRPLPYRPETPTHLLGKFHGESKHDAAGLGYYDLRSKDIRRKQSELARLHDIDGFIYHHYWFYDPAYNGPTLHAPLVNMLTDGYPDLPFFLNWCAISWVNVWMGRAQWQSRSEPINRNRAITLQKQYFNASDDQIREHYEWLKPFFHHDKYIKVRGQPIFFTYQWSEEMVPILKRLRELAIEDGFTNLYLIIGRGGVPTHIHDVSGLGEGHFKQMKRKNQPIDWFSGDLFNQTLVYPYASDFIHKPLAIPKWCKDGRKIPSYPEPRNKPEIYGIPMTFDNTPRRDFKVANLWNIGPVASVVERFRASLKSALTFDACCWHPSHRSLHHEERFIVINAWNEWGEGMSMEPSDVYGNKFLEAVKNVKLEVKALMDRNGGLTDDGRCVFVDGDEDSWNFMNDTLVDELIITTSGV